jgi:hypothetical protein
VRDIAKFKQLLEPFTRWKSRVSHIKSFYSTTAFDKSQKIIFIACLNKFSRVLI